MQGRIIVPFATALLTQHTLAVDSVSKLAHEAMQFAEVASDLPAEVLEMFA